MKLKKGDQVVVLVGKDKGKQGAVLNVLKEEGKVIIENVNMVKRHTKGNPMQGVPGGIVEQEKPIHVSNVAIWNAAKGKADRIGYRYLEDGKKVRFFKSDNEVMDI